MYFKEKIFALVQSRRFWAALLGVLVVVLTDVLGLDEKTAETIVHIIMAWIVGDSLLNTSTPRLERARKYE